MHLESRRGASERVATCSSTEPNRTEPTEALTACACAGRSRSLLYDPRGSTKNRTSLCTNIASGRCLSSLRNAGCSSADVRFAADREIPAMYGFTKDVEAGGLMSFAVELRQLYARAPVFIDKILKGCSPPRSPSSSRRASDYGSTSAPLVP